MATSRYYEMFQAGCHDNVRHGAAKTPGRVRMRRPTTGHHGVPRRMGIGRYPDMAYHRRLEDNRVLLP